MPRSRGLAALAGPLALLFVLVASISPSATSHEGGFCVGPVSLKAKAEKKVASLETKFAKNEVKTSGLAAKLAGAEADLVDAEADLATAEALPEGTAQEKKAKKKAVAAAESAVEKLQKTIAKLGKKIAKKEKKRGSLVQKILKVDPSRFFTFEPEPEGPSPFDPPWADVAPANVISFEHDGSLSNAQNGELLRQTILGLSPGDRLEIGDGTYSISNHFTAPLVGTSVAPIFVVAAEGATPKITRPNEYENVMNVGTTTPGSAQYLAFRGLEFEGGSMGIRIYGGSNVWIDRCEIHHTADAGLTANTVDTDHLYLTRNHIHHTAGYGEGMYLGANGGAVVMRDSIVARNHVHHTGTTGGQGDGIELKQGSHSNWIVEKSIHVSNYPCLFAYG
ncbi:MAG: right-handed parallel beta-helix repeat-containing protein, partial [Planctomycetota bacterium JB042]